MLILTSRNSFFRKFLSLLLDLSLDSAEMFSTLRLIFSSFLKCLLASTKTKEFDIKSVIKPAVTRTPDVIFPTYFEV